MTGADDARYVTVELSRKHERAVPSIVQPAAIRQHYQRPASNSVAFTIVSNDLFCPYLLETGGYTYHKDRVIHFRTNSSTKIREYIRKTIGDYRHTEQAPSSHAFYHPQYCQRRRRMIICPRAFPYMMAAPVGQNHPNTVEADAVDFGWMFKKEQNADNLRFLTALRMNATYPYILPNVHLSPSEPGVEIMDAGLLTIMA